MVQIEQLDERVYTAQRGRRAVHGRMRAHGFELQVFVVQQRDILA